MLSYNKYSVNLTRWANLHTQSLRLHDTLRSALPNLFLALALEKLPLEWGGFKPIFSVIFFLMSSPANSSYIYLHGFASSPNSTKAKYLRDRFDGLGIDLKTPDFNQNDFSNLTLTRQLQQIETEFFSPDLSSPSLKSEAQKKAAEVTVIGSSFGGLTAAWLAQRQLAVKQIVLLAPAFQFLSHWLPLLGQQQLEKWHSEGYLPVYHYGEQRYLPLNYRFVSEMAKYPEEKLMRSVPALILHGKHDTIIPIQASRNFAANRPWVKLIELEDDHSLGNVLATIWEAIQKFCQLKN
jgi:uncharacterized protein